MHVRVNIDIEAGGNFLHNQIIPVKSDFVFFFMMVSVFSFCSVYYDQFESGAVYLISFINAVIHVSFRS